MSVPTAAHTKSTGIGVLGLALMTTGVVYGDIGTSVLYAVNEIFFGHGPLPRTPDNITGAISLSLWALTLIITIKYVCFVLYADHRGEGGVFALFAKLNGENGRVKLGWMCLLLLLAAGFLYGDGIITPAISVLSAVEGLNVVTTAYSDYTRWIAAGLLLILFLPQRLGTGGVSFLFSPVMIVWFVAIAVLGWMSLQANPEILWALNPWHAIHFLAMNDIWTNLEVMGSVMLVVTGGEALYADMGHFGRRPIQIGWMALVYPSLLLNYLGQGAYLLSGRTIVQENIFFSMVPEWALYPMVGLGTAAAIIASQALITGAYSLTAQAYALGLLPRFRTNHTSSRNQGQIYIPFVNGFLLVGCLYLVITWGSSESLANAYGLAVSGLMLVTSMAMCHVATVEWKWPVWRVAILFGAFAALDAFFLFANSLKFLHGGYLPLAVGGLLFIVMTTWRKGRLAIAGAYARFTTKTIDWLIRLRDKAKEVEYLTQSGLPDTAQKLEAGRSLRFLHRGSVFMSSRPVRAKEDRVPAPLRIFLKRYGAIPEEIIILHVHVVAGVPFVNPKLRHEVVDLTDGIKSVICHYGFREDVKVQNDLDALERNGQVRLDDRQWTVEVGEHELAIHPGPTVLERAVRWLRRRFTSSAEYEGTIAGKSMLLPARMQYKLYRWLERLAVPLSEHFTLEGMQVSKIVIPVAIAKNDARIEMPDMEI